MQVIDTSALLAVVLAEPDHDLFMAALHRPGNFISAATVHEAEVVVLRRIGADRVIAIRQVLETVTTAIIPFDDDQSRLATQAYERFGKGRHPARLGLLDCAAYALAKFLDAPLLYKGDDFAQTDIVSALT